MSDANRWRRAHDLFAAAAELDPKQRESFLAGETAGDVDMIREVLELLEADEQASRFLDSRALAGGDLGAAVANPWLGRRFGAYEVVGELGRGGMGTVLLGDRADGRYKGQVAIKVLRSTLVGGDLVERFHAEGQILASLDHPHIARLLDAGDTEDGLSYLVMEYVNGPRIDVYADEHLLDVPSRLRLFRAVLQGADYAHARGVIHRDLKPSNILVTSDGRPKIVDFGIAKLLKLEASADARADQTRLSRLMMTPEFASPEQVRGELVDPTSDVYSLGIVLYRLLTGRQPYGFPTTRPSDAERVICEQAPRRPSEAVENAVRSGGPDSTDQPTEPAPAPDVVARTRSSTRDRLQRALRGDLDTIVLKALSKERSERYATAGAFADDIDRHLDGHAIRARSPSSLYRARRFVRRRRLPLAVAGLVVAGLSAAVWQAGVATTQRQQAQASNEELTELAVSVMNSLQQMEMEEIGATATREAAVTATVQSLDQLVSRIEGEPDPDLLMTVARGYRDAGSVQGHPFAANLGKIAEAKASYESAIGLLEQVLETAPQTDGVVADLAVTRLMLSDVTRALGEPTAARPLLELAQPVLDSLAQANPDSVILARWQALAYERLGTSFEATGDLDASTTFLRRALDVREAMPFDRMDGATAREELLALAVLKVNVGRSFSLNANRVEAVQLGREAANLSDSLAALPEAAPRTIRVQGVAHTQLGWRFIEDGQLESADSSFARAIGILRPLSDSDAENFQFLADLGYAYEGRGQARIRAEKWEGALSDHREAIAILEPRLASLPSAGYVVAQAHRQAGEALTGLSRFGEAESALARSLDLARGLQQRDTTFVPAKKVLALTHSSLETLYLVRAEDESLASHCIPARQWGDSARVLWSAMDDVGQIGPGEALIWEDFRARKPAGIC